MSCDPCAIPMEHGEDVISGWSQLPWLIVAIATCALVSSPVSAQPVRIAPPGRVSPIDWLTSPLDLDLRGMNGVRYAFRCPPGKPQPSRVVGSGPYTDHSSICSAAVHAGAIRAMGGDVVIEIRPGEARYVGSEHNFIRSIDYDGRWSGSFIVLDERTPNRR